MIDLLLYLSGPNCILTRPNCDKASYFFKRTLFIFIRLCNAYLASGRGGEYLEVLTAELDEVISSKDFTEERVQSLKDKFPRGGAMGLLESNPELVDAYTSLAHKFLILGYVAPMNVLWTYHFIGGRHELATPLWDKYVKTCPQIMFQKVSSGFFFEHYSRLLNK